MHETCSFVIASVSEAIQLGLALHTKLYGFVAKSSSP
jgi:hypothetical protein